MVTDLLYFTISLTLNRKLSSTMLRLKAISISFMLFDEHFILVIYFFYVCSGAHPVSHLQIFRVVNLSHNVQLLLAFWGLNEATISLVKSKMASTNICSLETHGSLRSSSIFRTFRMLHFKISLKIVPLFEDFLGCGKSIRLLFLMHTLVLFTQMILLCEPLLLALKLASLKCLFYLIFHFLWEHRFLRYRTVIF